MRYAQLFDGTKLSFPDDTPDEVINRVAREETLKRNAPPVQAPVAPSTERTAGEAVTDIGAALVSGTGRMLAFPGQAISLVPGLRGVGSAIASPGEAIAEFGEGLKSQGLKVREALRSQAISEAEKDGILAEFGTAIKETLKDPALISTFLTEQAPNFLPPMLVGRLAAKIGVSAIKGLTGEAAEQAVAQAQRRGVAAAVGTGAAMQSADISSEAYKQAYEAAIAQGKPPEQAESEANNAARIAAGGAFGVSLATQRLPGARAIEQRLVGAPGGVSRVVGGVGEATAESLEEAGGALFQNIGVRTVDPSQSLTQGVGAAAGLGLLGGGFFGTLLSKKATPEPLPGQLPGETIEQSILRLVTERESLKTPPVPEAIIPDVDVIKLAGSLDEKGNPIGYGLLTRYEEKLKQLPESPERNQALQVASSVKERLSIESIQRQQSSYQNIITYKDMKDLGFTEADPLYESLVGKNIGTPDDATKVIDALNKELEQDIPSQRRELVGVMLEQVQSFLDQVPGSAFYAPRTDQRADGAGASVSDQLGAGTAGVPEAPTDVSLGADTKPAGKADVREEAQPRPLRFETESGPVELSETGDPADKSGPVLYTDPESANQIKQQIADPKLTYQVGFGRSFPTGDAFYAVNSQSEIPAGADPYIAVVNRADGSIVSAYPAEIRPQKGFVPVQKRMKPGLSTVNIGSPISRVLTDKDIVTPKMLEDLGIKKQSAVAKRILGKEVKSAEVKAELAKRKQSLRTEEAQEQPQETPQEVSPPETPKERIDAINKQLEGLMKRLLSKYGLKDVSVQIVKDMAAKGEFSGRLIKLADDTDNPLVDLRHEAIHALKELGFFTPAQWETLKNKAAQEWVQTYLKDAPYTDKVSRYEAYKQMFEAEGKNPQEVEEALIEEAIADAFSYFNKTRAPSGLMASINFRLKNLFKAFKAFLDESSLSAEDIFGRIEGGKLPSKAEVKEAEKAEAKKSLVSGVPRSTRLIMEASTPFAQSELGLETQKKKGATGANNVRDIARALNEQTIANFGAMSRDDLAATNANDLARALADEVGYQLRATATTGTGLGWYSNNYPKALDKLATRFPELKTNKTARSVFTACVAVSSNGEDVSTNIKNAILMYEDVREGRAIREIGARRADALNNNKAQITALLDRYGDNFTSELLKTTTVKEMNAQLRAMGEKTDSSYLANTTVPVAAIYFGPKLGAFYANLMGAEGYLTMDMWWTRTMNRMRGLLMPSATESSISKFRQMMGNPTASREEVVNATKEWRDQYEAQGYTTELEFLAGDKEPSNKAELPAWTKKARRKAGPAFQQLEFEHRAQKMANTIWKNEREMLEEAPFTGTDRAFMYKVARDAQKILKQEGIDLSLADIQAAIWYYEKRLYAKLSGRTADDIGYDEAITRSSAAAGPAGPSVVFPNKPNAGYVPPRKSADVDQVRGEPEAIREEPAEVKRSLRAPRSPLGFYSELENKVADMGPNQAPPAQWKTMIKALPQKGVKPEEIEWSSVNDWLDLQEGKVKKDDLINYLRANGVQVEEVVLGGSRRRGELRIEYSEPSDTWSVVDEESNVIESGMPDLDAAEAVLEGLNQEENVGTKYGQYVLPGGTNYREVLLTLPTQTPSYDEVTEFAKRWVQKEFDRRGNRFTDNQEKVDQMKDDIWAWNDLWGEAAAEKYGLQKRSRIIPDHFRKTVSVEKEGQYKSAHWDQPNVIAHIRLNDRTDADGNKVLFVEEIQSDWGQEGKKKGFIKGLSNTENSELDKLVDIPPWERTVEQQQRFLELNDRRLSGVVAAPFVTKTEVWLNLALKRIMIMAAEGGYDKVAFINGNQSADRYDLSQQVRKIFGRPLEDGRLQVEIKLIGGRDGPIFIVNSEQELADKIGKEPAERLLQKFETSDRNEEQFISGGDLKVGGEGMKAFYDTIVPTALKKLLPKVGGGQIRVVSFPDAAAVRDGSRDKLPEQEVGNQPGFDVTPAMREKVAEGLPKFSLRSQTAWTDKRIDSLLSSYAYTQSDREGDAKAYAARITPREFLNATASDTDEQRIAAETKALDPEELAKTDVPINLEIRKERDGDYQIVNHEGRHRMMALANAGYDRGVPVVLVNRPYGAVQNAEPVEEAYLRRQSFGTRAGRKGINVQLMVPISWKYRAELKDQFGGEADVRFSLRSPDTKAFKQWFGDSKVVDADGKPLVVYHGTRNDFSQFEKGRVGGMYFTPDTEYAEQYGDRLMPVYLKISKMADLTDTNSDAYKLAIKTFNDAGGWASNEDSWDYAQEQGRTDPMFDPKKDLTWEIFDLPEAGVDEALRKAGYDGIKLEERSGIDSYVVFNPTQIKSAIGNIGTFDPNNPDIRYSLRSDKRGAWYKDATPQQQNTLDRWEDERVTGSVSNWENLNIRPAREDIYESASAHFYDYEKATGLFDIPISDIGPLSGYDTDKDKNRIKNLAEQIKENGEIEPVFVAVDPNGESYLMEGQHRTRALVLLGYNSVPARVIVSMDQEEQLGETSKLSLRTPKQNIRSQIPQNILTRVDATIAFREDKTFARRMMDAISPRGFSWFREQAINRYEYLAKIDRKRVNMMGGVRLLADQSAEAAALFSDLGAGITASAFGVHDRVGGIPVYRNGVVKVSNENNTIKGPLAVFAPLGKYGDPEVYRLYEFWATVKRGARLDAQGKLTPFTPADMAHAQALERQFPEFVTIQREWIKYNDGLVKFMQDTGVITPQAAQEFKQHGDYFPMYKYFEGDEVTGPKVFSSIANVAPPKKYKGDDQPLGDFFENVVRNTQAAIQAGIKNIAAQRATQVAVAVKEVTPLKFKPKKLTPEVYRVLENGMERYYAANDMMMISALKSLNIPDLPLIGVFAGPANLLRNLITKTPDFMLANMLRDSLSAWVTSGKNITPITSTLINFSKAIAEKSPELNALRNAGILGGYDYAQGVEATAQTFAKDLRKISNSRTTMEKITSPVTSLWGALEKASSASDAATRMEVYKKTLAETGNEAEALFQALEIMNFNRKGRSPVIRALTAAVPFLNARIQGLDVLYRAGIRPLFAGDATAQERARAKTFFLRGATIMALSAMYWMMTHDDDEYKVQEQETRDNYWLLPSMGVKIPIPFEIGVIFKVIPERILEYSFGDDTGKDFVNAMSRQLLNTFSFNPIPQTVLPVVEAATNYSFFTTRPILGQGMEGIAPEFQATPTTSKTAVSITDAYNSVIDLMPDAVAKKLRASPVILEHLIQGYTGTMGMYAMQTMDYIISANSDVPNASKRFEQMPVIRRFAVDPQARGTVTAFYDMKNAVDSVTRTANYLERTMNFEDQAEFVRDNIKVLAAKDYIQSLEKTMKEFREQKMVIRASTMSAEAKRSYLDIIEKMELQLTSNIRTLQKQMSSF